MLGFFRNIFKSRIGVGVTLAFLVLIAIAFVSADVTGGMFGGVTGGDRVATVGKTRIGTAELRQRVTNIFDQQRQDPQSAGLTMKQFLAGDTLDQIVDGMIGRVAMYQFGLNHGMVASDRLIDSELLKLADFKGLDGKFDEQAFRRFLSQKGYTETAVRADIAHGLIASQLNSAALYGTSMPQGMVKQYLAIFKERRTGTVAMIPSAAFAPKTPPTDQVIAGFYNTNKARYMQPERRTIRYLAFSEATLKNVPVPTEAEIAKRYNDNKAAYAPAELRSATQVIVLTEAAAKALAAEVAGGKSLEVAAAAKGLVPSKMPNFTREAMAAQTSPAVAASVFATPQGQLAQPAKGALGWAVVRVDAISQKSGKSLDQARAEITTELTADKRRKALSDLAAQIDDEIGRGRSLADVANETGTTIATTPELVANGAVFGKPGEQGPAEVAPILAGAFAAAREGKPQLAAGQSGTAFMAFEVGTIVPATPAPLAEIKPIVTRDWMLEQGSTKASEAATKVLAQLGKGVALDVALKAVGVPLPPPEPVDMGRQQVMQSQQRVPPPIALLFAMAKHSSKRLEAPGKQGWYIVTVNDVIPGTITDGDPVLAAASGQFGGLVGREFAEQLADAIKAEVAPEKNPAAIKAVRTDLVGTGQ